MYPFMHLFTEHLHTSPSVLRGGNFSREIGSSSCLRSSGKAINRQLPHNMPSIKAGELTKCSEKVAKIGTWGQGGREVHFKKELEFEWQFKG